MNARIDRADRKILSILQRDCTLPVADIARQVGLSTTPCWRRIQRLREEGVFKDHPVILNREKVGLTTMVFAHVKLTSHGRSNLSAFAEAVRKYPEVMECCVVTGQSSDYLLKAVVPDMEYYEKFLLGKLTRIPGVTGVHSSFELRRVVLDTALPLEHIEHN